jgi:hypothetical protein
MGSAGCIGDWLGGEHGTPEGLGKGYRFRIDPSGIEVMEANSPLTLRGHHQTVITRIRLTRGMGAITIRAVSHERRR